MHAYFRVSAASAAKRDSVGGRFGLQKTIKAGSDACSAFETEFFIHGNASVTYFDGIFTAELDTGSASCAGPVLPDWISQTGYADFIECFAGTCVRACGYGNAHFTGHVFSEVAFVYFFGEAEGVDVGKFAPVGSGARGDVDDFGTFCSYVVSAGK